MKQPYPQPKFSKSDALILFLLVFVVGLYAAPYINDKITAADRAQCLEYDTPQMPDWCNTLLESELGADQ